MTRTEIIAELRRSAAEDEEPSKSVNNDGFLAARKYCEPHTTDEWITYMSNRDCRTFFLLVAHALEDECAAT